MKTVSSVRRCPAQLDRPEQRRLSVREFGPSANNQFKFILESPKKKAAHRPPSHPIQASRHSVNQQFNTVHIVMSNRLNPTKTGENLHESRRQESLGRRKKNEER